MLCLNTTLPGTSVFLKFSVLVINLRQLLSFEGEGDKGGEVNKHSQVHSIDISSHPYGKIVIGL